MRKSSRGGAVLRLALGLLLLACNGGDGATGVAEADMVGKWVLRKYRSEGFFKSGSLTIPLDEDTAFTDDRSYIDLKADRTFVSDLPDSEGGATVEVGSWSLAGRTMTTIGSEDGVGEPDTLRWTVSVAGSTAAFSYHVDEQDSLVQWKQDVRIDAIRK